MKKIIFIFVLLSASAIGVFCWANFARAADSSYAGLTIAEIMYNPAGNNAEHAKWVEFANLSSKTITLSPTGSKTASGWKIKDLKITDPSNHYLYAQENTPIEINPGDLLIVADNLINFGNDYPDLKEVPILKSAIALTTADSSGNYNLTLFDNTFALDTIIYSKDWYENTDDKGKSLEKIDLYGDNEKVNWQESCKNSGTPGKEPGICETETDTSDKSSGTENSNAGSGTNDAGNNDTAPNTSNFCAATSSNIRLNEIFPYPESGNEFIEIANTGKDCADVSGWKMMDEAGHEKTFPENSVLHSGEYLSLEGNLYLNNDSDTIYLLGTNGTAKSDALDRGFYEKAQKGFSYSFDGKSWRWTSSPTPKEENIITTADSEEGVNDAGSEEKYSAAENVYLNEILPNPKDGSNDEYIEIASGESGLVDLFGWRLKDGSKSKGYQFKEHIILNSGEYFAIYRSDSKITLNNSDESVNLYNPQGEVVSSAAFDKSQKNASYNFDGENWKWSKYLTPGKKNKFDSEPSVKIKKPKKVFKDIFAEFSTKAKDKETKKLKYAWDFGDGKKSYLAKTSHKYLATGKYTVTLSVSDESQTVEKNFVIAVKNYPRPDLEIVKIVPNPTGNDSDRETIDIKNNSEKKVDLESWKIATESENKIYNHPISDGITLSSDETKIITREMSKFILNNKSGKVQLVSPDGKIIDEVIYTKEKISEGETYVKTNGEWQWISSSEKEKSSEKEDPNEAKGEENSTDEEGEVLGATDENQTDLAPKLTLYTPEDAFIFFKFFGLQEYKPREANFCPSIQPANTLAYF